MALDEALMFRAARTREAVLRIYTWTTPTLSLGRNQRAASLYDEEAMAEQGIDVVRRPTGGRALMHHREITYSVTAPITSDAGLLHVYARVNELLLNALRSLGVPALIAERSSSAPSPGTLPCFAEPAAGEITVDGAKLVGSAQWRDSGALLQHGSIIVEDDQQLATALLRHSDHRQPVPRAATLRSAMGRVPAIEEVADALFHSVREMEDPSARLLEGDDALEADASHAENRYRDAGWTWRR